MPSKKSLGHDYETKIRTIDVEPKEGVDFKGLLLSEATLRGLNESGFHRPSPIQLEAIPLGKCGLDLLVQSKSGTGKTCVFVVVALEMLQFDHKGIQVLILAPTREVAVQICDVAVQIGEFYRGLAAQSFIGGLPFKQDVEKLKRCHIAVGTPGRVKQLIKNGSMKTDSIKLMVLDEADKLIGDSLQDDINWIFSSLPVNKQMMTFSATYTEPFVKFITKYMRSPTLVRLNFDDPALLGITQYFQFTKFNIASHIALKHKVDALINMFGSISFNQCLVFTNYQIRAESLCNMLQERGWSSAFICGTQDQEKRLDIISKLKNVECRILISTDLTARGIDAENVDLVVHIDVPWDSETLFHRMGRAGRFGAQGISVILIGSDNDFEQLAKIQKNRNLKLYILPDNLRDIWSHKPTAESHFDNFIKSKRSTESSRNCDNEEKSENSSFELLAKEKNQTSKETVNVCAFEKFELNYGSIAPNNTKNQTYPKESVTQTRTSSESVREMHQQNETQVNNNEDDLKTLQSYLNNQKKKFVSDNKKILSDIVKDESIVRQIVQYYGSEYSIESEVPEALVDLSSNFSNISITENDNHSDPDSGVVNQSADLQTIFNSFADNVVNYKTLKETPILEEIAAKVNSNVSACDNVVNSDSEADKSQNKQGFKDHVDSSSNGTSDCDSVLDFCDSDSESNSCGLDSVSYSFDRDFCGLDSVLDCDSNSEECGHCQCQIDLKRWYTSVAYYSSYISYVTYTSEILKQ